MLLTPFPIVFDTLVVYLAASLTPSPTSPATSLTPSPTSPAMPLTPSPTSSTKSLVLLFPLSTRSPALSTVLVNVFATALIKRLSLPIGSADARCSDPKMTRTQRVSSNFMVTYRLQVVWNRSEWRIRDYDLSF